MFRGPDERSSPFGVSMRAAPRSRKHHDRVFEIVVTLGPFLLLGAFMIFVADEAQTWWERHTRRGRLFRERRHQRMLDRIEARSREREAGDATYDSSRGDGQP